MAKKLSSILKRKLAPLALSALIPAMLVGKEFAKPTNANAAASTNITYTEAYNGSYWDYFFNYENTSNTQENLFSMYLYFDSMPLVEWIDLGNGWDSTLAGFGPLETSFLDSFSTAPDYDIIPWNNLAGFNFRSNTQLGNINYDAFFDGVGGQQSLSGNASLVPEPVSSVLFATGAGALAASRYLKRKLGNSKRDKYKLR